ncbi:MAG: hypothetical protein V1867_08170 [Candidatus Falkowbacteria bacterium]
MDSKKITVYDHVIEDHSGAHFHAYMLKACPVCGGKHLDTVDICPEKNQPITARAAKRLAKEKYIAENIPDMKYMMRSLVAGAIAALISILTVFFSYDKFQSIDPDKGFTITALAFMLPLILSYVVGVRLEVKRKNRVLAEFEAIQRERGKIK